MNNMYALSYVVIFAFTHLSLGIFWSQEIKQAYDMLSTRGVDTMFFLSIFIAYSSAGALAITNDKKNLPSNFWSNWKENVQMVFIYVSTIAVICMWFYSGFTLGFFNALEQSWVYMLLAGTVLIVLLGQTVYWTLMIYRNKNRRE